MVKKEKKNIIEIKAKELAKLIFLKSKRTNQVCISGITSRKSKDLNPDGFKIDGLCFKRKDIMGVK